MRESPLVSAVIPVFEEEAVIDTLVERCLAVGRGLAHPFELVLVDDGSRDRSPELLRAAAQRHPGEVVFVRLNRNYGQHAALLAGFQESRGEYIVTLDADLQNPPEEIPRIVAELDRGFDVVGTVRRHRRDSLFRKLSSRITNWLVRRTTGVRMHDYGCMLRGYHRTVVQAMLDCRERSTFIPILANSFACRTTEIDVDHSARDIGESKYGIWKLIHLQCDLLTSMSTFPLRVLSIVGGLISFFGIAFGALLMTLRLLNGPEWAADGVFTLFSVLFTFIGAQFIGMGILGEYLGRIYHDVRARPRYSTREVVRLGSRPRSGRPADRVGSSSIPPESRSENWGAHR